MIREGLFCRAALLERGRVLANQGNTAQFGKQIRREIFRQVKVWKVQEYFVYFKLFKPQNRRKRSA